jgi:dihydroorotase
MWMAASTSADGASGSPEGGFCLRGGLTIDLVSGEVRQSDVLIGGNVITAVGPNLTTRSDRHVIDVGGCYVLPGLVDLHAHVFHGVGDSVAADDACLARGTVTVVDGGSSGAATVDAFRRVAQSSRTEVLAWLNLATIGLADTSVGELIMGPFLNPAAARKQARHHAGFVVGIKARLSTYAAGGGALRILRVLRKVANELSLPVMVHVGDTDEPLEELITYLRPGDVVTHAMTGRKHGVLDANGHLRPGFADAQRDGLIFDAARGRNHLSFAVLARCIEQGFLPDTLSTDMTLAMARDPSYGLPTLGSYLLAHGVPLSETFARMTRAPASVIGRQLPAQLSPGQRADLTVMAVDDRPVMLEDVDGRRIKASRSLVAVGTVRAGQAAFAARAKR